MRFHIQKRVWVTAITAVVAFVLISSVGWALTNGPNNTTDFYDLDGITHSSTVHYTRQLSPFIAWVDKIYYGGRKPGGLSPFGCCGEWARDSTQYKEWNGSSWVTVVSFGASSWRDTGTPGLAYWNLNDDVTLEGGALAKHRLKYRYFVNATMTYNNVTGSYHNHFLE